MWRTALVAPGVWNIPRPGIKPLSPASANGLLTVEPMWRPLHIYFFIFIYLFIFGHTESLLHTRVFSSCCSPRGAVAEEKPTVTPCWNFFLDLLLVAFVIIILQNGLPQRILPFCLTAKLKCLCSEACPPKDGRKEEMNTSPA